MKISKNIFNMTPYLILLILLVCSNCIARDNFGKNIDTVRVIVSGDIIGNVNRTDVRAALELWVGEMMIELSDNTVSVIPEIINSLDEIKERIKQNKADIIGLFALDYVKYGSKLPISPVFVLKRNSEIGDKYLLITRKDNSINSLSDLKSKKILTFKDRKGKLVEKWLFVEMKKKRVENPKEIIDNFTKILEPTKRIFSVFFGKADGCLISKTKFESMCELNPQLKKQLKVLRESPTYLTEIYFTNKNSKNNKVHETKNYTSFVNNSKNGTEMLRLFKAVEIVNFEDKYIETIEKLIKEYNKYN